MIDNPGNLKLELTPDQLKAISGGTYTPEQEQELLAISEWARPAA